MFIPIGKYLHSLSLPIRLAPPSVNTFSSRPRALKPHFMWTKLVPGKWPLPYPSYSGRADFSYISLKKIVPNRLHEKQKTGSVRRVNLLAGPIFLHINTLARPAGSTQSRSENQSMRASAVGSGGELKFFLINSGLR